MHELTLATNMMAIVEQHARRDGFRQVATIRLEIGQLSCVTPEALRFCFAAVTRGTIADGAQLDIVSVAGAGRCPRCGRSFAIEEPFGLCADCDTPLEITAGTEMRLLELEVA